MKKLIPDELLAKIAAQDDVVAEILAKQKELKANPPRPAIDVNEVMLDAYRNEVRFVHISPTKALDTAARKSFEKTLAFNGCEFPEEATRNRSSLFVGTNQHNGAAWEHFPLVIIQAPSLFKEDFFRDLLCVASPEKGLDPVVVMYGYKES